MSVLVVMWVKTGISPPSPVTHIDLLPENISSRTNISQPQSVSGPITATQRLRVQPDRAATSTDRNLSEPRISADNIASGSPLQPWCLNVQTPIVELISLHCYKKKKEKRDPQQTPFIPVFFFFF